MPERNDRVIHDNTPDRELREHEQATERSTESDVPARDTATERPKQRTDEGERDEPRGSQR